MLSFKRKPRSNLTWSNLQPIIPASIGNQAQLDVANSLLNLYDINSFPPSTVQPSMQAFEPNKSYIVNTGRIVPSQDMTTDRYPATSQVDPSKYTISRTTQEETSKDAMRKLRLAIQDALQTAQAKSNCPASGVCNSVKGVIKSLVNTWSSLQNDAIFNTASYANDPMHVSKVTCGLTNLWSSMSRACLGATCPCSDALFQSKFIIDTIAGQLAEYESSGTTGIGSSSRGK